MSPLNRKTLRIFWGVIMLVIAVLSLWDVWLASNHPPDEWRTISWSMALLGQQSPFLVFVIGHVSGALIWGLALHFWSTMTDPVTWDELQRLRRENQELLSENRALKSRARLVRSGTDGSIT